jgi:polar amino acid transport system substrate-binding protein
MISLILMVAACGGNKEKEIKSAAEMMEKHKEVRIITDAVNAPFEFGSGTGVQGLDVDLGNEIGKDLGIPVKWVKVSGYEHLFELLKDGQAEIVISAIAVDPKKEPEFSFSTPYYDSGDAIAIGPQKVEEIKDLAALAGKKVGVTNGRPADSFMASQKSAAGVNIQKFSTMDDALGALNRTEIDAVIGDEPLITYSSFKSYPNTVTLPNLINKYQYAVVVRKSEPQLLAKINATIDRLKSAGELKKFEQTWFENVRKGATDMLQGVVKENAAKKAPKSIGVTIERISGAFSMDRLDGFVLVLEGANKYQSTPILTDGNKGNCRFTQPVPPGEYKLAMSIFKMVTKVAVPDLAKTSLVMDMKISSGGIAITLK